MKSQYYLKFQLGTGRIDFGQQPCLSEDWVAFMRQQSDSSENTSGQMHSCVFSERLDDCQD